MAIDAASLFETFVQNVESYLLWDKLKTEPHQAGTFTASSSATSVPRLTFTRLENSGRRLGSSTTCEPWPRLSRDSTQGPFSQSPIRSNKTQNNAPAAVRAAWPSVKATLEAATIPQPDEETPAPKGRSGRRPSTKPLASYANTRRNRTPPMAWSEIAVEYLSEHPEATTNAAGKPLTWNHVRDAWRRYYGDKKPKQHKRPAKKNAQNI